MGNHHPSKTQFLDAALLVVRTKGYEATTIDDICAAANLTKGSFFHHFKSKEELALAAAQHFSDMAENLFAHSSHHAHSDPLDRILGYVDLRIAILQGDLPAFTCLLGTMLQETYQTHPAIREACNLHISSHAATLEADIAATMRTHGGQTGFTVESLALYTQAVIQGAFILAKAKSGPEVAAECLHHLRRYLELLFASPNNIKDKKGAIAHA